MEYSIGIFAYYIVMFLDWIFWQSSKIVERKQAVVNEKNTELNIFDVSPNIGMRTIGRYEHNENRRMLNEYLKEMYLASRGMKVSQDIYRLMQRVDREKYTDWNKEAFDELSKSCGDIRAGWK